MKERSNPKWYWIDIGVMRAAKGTLSTPSFEEKGALFEGFIAMILRAGNDYKFFEYDKIAYWSPPGGKTEVDFVIERGSKKLAIEVKATSQPNSSHLKGLRAIQDLKGLVHRILVYPGNKDRTTDDGIRILGIKTFLRELAKGFSAVF